MNDGRVKVNENGRRGGAPLWVWLLPIFLILALLAWFLVHHRASKTAPMKRIVAEPAMSFTSVPALGTVLFATDQAA